MAKESLKAREIKRAKLVAKYSAKRAELKKIMKGDDYDAKRAADIANSAKAPSAKNKSIALVMA